MAKNIAIKVPGKHPLRLNTIQSPQPTLRLLSRDLPRDISPRFDACLTQSLYRLYFLSERASLIG